MFRFFVDEKHGEYFNLSKDTIKHMKVARVTDDSFICVYEGKFFECVFELESARIVRELDENHEFDKEVVVAAAIIDTKRFEWLIQKASELGATKLIPVISKNVSKKISDEMSRKIERWNLIALNASEQSFRNKQMVVTDLMKFNEVIEMQYENKFIAHEKENGKVSHSFPTDSIFLVGPEGGFTEEEVKLATQKGFDVISLGKRILRAETASMFVLARVNEG